MVTILLLVQIASLWRPRKAILRKAVEDAAFIFLLISKFLKHFVMLKVEHCLYFEIIRACTITLLHEM